jgi:hypothetical protein
MAIALVKSKSPTSGESWSSLLFGLLCVLAAIGALTFCSPAVAQDERLTRTTKTAHDLVILGYARSNQSCDGVEPPALYLDKPPDHGTVCFRTNDVRLREAIVGNLTHCVGRKISGVSVVYFSRWGYIGSDDLRYTVVFPQARHGVYVDITVMPDQSGSPGTMPSDISAPYAEAPQLPGPIPACTAVVS